MAASEGFGSAPPFSKTDPELERETLKHGERLFAQMDQSPNAGFFSKKAAYARLMDWSMKDPAFKTQLFRFVDVAPSLREPQDVIEHLREYLGDRAVELSPAMKAGLAAASFAPGLVAAPIKAQLSDLARQFVAGESPRDLVRRFLANAESEVATTVDLLGEAVLTEEEADRFLERNLEVLDVLTDAIQKHPVPAFSDVGPNGPLPRLNLSLKISALAPDVRPIDPGASLQSLKRRLRPLLHRAAQVGAFVNFDMESYRLKDLTLELFKSVLSEPDFSREPAVGIALQAYLRDAEQDLRDLIAWSNAQRRPISVRLVKGAYWDYETTWAQQQGWPIPVWQDKAASDANYEKLSSLLLQNYPLISAAIASHNVRSCAHAIAQAEKLGLDPRSFEFQALFGMADDLKSGLVKLGYRVREYCPVGELLPGMAYLVRRLLENTSNEGFLRAKAAAPDARSALLRNPQEQLQSSKTAATAARTSGFANATNTDFVKRPARDRLVAALDHRRQQVRRVTPLVIGGQRYSDRPATESRNPAHPEQVLGAWCQGSAADAELAVQAAATAQPAWNRLGAEERSRLFQRVADLLEARRTELTALEILEAGKPWIEADADVSEAIDFCRYYAAEMTRLGRGAVTQPTPGERNRLHFVPRGVAAVIAPWNFPLAILCGMTVAAAVAGNTVVMKPAEQTSLIGAAFMDTLEEAGIPAGVVNLLTGSGEIVGPVLVSHPRVDIVAFTGSRAVGLKIWEMAGRTVPGQQNLKKVVCEMGGKNALIIDKDADLDEALPAILYSAFGFSGQKCSALSRLIVHAGVYDALAERLAGAAKTLSIGDPADPGTQVGPVIDAEAQQRLLAQCGQARSDHAPLFVADLPASVRQSAGYYVPPTIVGDVDPRSALAREELFGPVLAVLKAKSFDHALELANQSEYALTAGLFSRQPSHLERAAAELRAGNVYLNRGITGALVQRHPFGGYGMSGGGTKAGGPGYLENFLFPKVSSENTLRRGFTPPETGE